MKTDKPNPSTVAGLVAAATASADNPAAAADAAASQAATINVAYHDGPPAIGYFGSRWERGKSKSVSSADWDAMRARADCAPFDFRVV